MCHCQLFHMGRDNLFGGHGVLSIGGSSCTYITVSWGHWAVSPPVLIVVWLMSRDGHLTAVNNKQCTNVAQLNR
jgi:hypothetical protein